MKSIALIFKQYIRENASKKPVIIEYRKCLVTTGVNKDTMRGEINNVTSLLENILFFLLINARENKKNVKYSISVERYMTI